MAGKRKTKKMKTQAGRQERVAKKKVKLDISELGELNQMFMYHLLAGSSDARSHKVYF